MKEKPECTPSVVAPKGTAKAATILKQKLSFGPSKKKKG